MRIGALPTRGYKSEYFKTHLFKKIPPDLPFSGVQRRLVTGLKDILETVRVTGTNLRMGEARNLLAAARQVRLEAHNLFEGLRLRV